MTLYFIIKWDCVIREHHKRHPSGLLMHCVRGCVFTALPLSASIWGPHFLWYAPFKYKCVWYPERVSNQKYLSWQNQLSIHFHWKNDSTNHLQRRASPLSPFHYSKARNTKTFSVTDKPKYFPLASLREKDEKFQLKPSLLFCKWAIFRILARMVGIYHV